MADDKTFTKDELDAAVKKAVEAATGDVDGLKSKVEELIGDNKKLKSELRAKSEIKPEDVATIEAERDKAQSDLAEATKQIKALTTERDKAVKALETEQGAARSYALEAEINAAIAAGNVVPALVPAFTAMVKQQAKAELVDGKYAVTIGDKPAKEYIDGFLSGDDGKAFKAAANNSGGGSPGAGSNTGSGPKTMARSAWDALSPADKVAFGKDGGQVVDQAA